MGRAMIDESGKTYGFLKVLTPKPLPNRNKRGWECECLLCGNKKVISGSDLRTGKATSCGCKRQYIIQEKPGTRYGYLEVIKIDPTPAKDFPDKSIHWMCKCHNCNSQNLISVSGRNLRNGNTQSCGCIRSQGELAIISFLEENSIDYQREYTFNDLKDNNNLRFDFALFKDKNLIGLIEFNGAQHYKENSYFQSGDDLKLRQKHDEMKVEYCLDNDIPLYVINNEINLTGNKLKEQIIYLLNYIKNDIKGENKNVKVSYLDFRDLQSR